MLVPDAMHYAEGAADIYRLTGFLLLLARI